MATQRFFNPVLQANDMLRIQHLSRFPVRDTAARHPAAPGTRQQHTAPQRTPPAAGSNKCGLPIMQPAYLAIFRRMGKDLGVDPLFIMASAVQESGWNLVHVFGTNAKSNGKPLNNLFGTTFAGGDNIPYPSLDASAKAWEDNWGPYLASHPQTIEAYAAALVSNPVHKYNTNPAYPGEIAKRYKQLLDAANACGLQMRPTPDAPSALSGTNTR